MVDRIRQQIIRGPRLEPRLEVLDQVDVRGGAAERLALERLVLRQCIGARPIRVDEIVERTHRQLGALARVWVENHDLPRGGALFACTDDLPIRVLLTQHLKLMSVARLFDKDARVAAALIEQSGEEAERRLLAAIHAAAFDIGDEQVEPASAPRGAGLEAHRRQCMVGVEMICAPWANGLVHGVQCALNSTAHNILRLPFHALHCSRW